MGRGLCNVNNKIWDMPPRGGHGERGQRMDEKNASLHLSPVHKFSGLLDVKSLKKTWVKVRCLQNHELWELSRAHQ